MSRFFVLRLDYLSSLWLPWLTQEQIGYSLAPKCRFLTKGLYLQNMMQSVLDGKGLWMPGVSDHGLTGTFTER